MGAERRPTDSERAARPPSDRTTTLAARMEIALGEYEASYCDPRSAEGARELLAEWNRLCGGSEDHDRTRRDLWARVAEGRARLRHASTPAPESPSVPQSTVDRIERLHAELAEAEERAHRKLASPKSYRKLIAARTQLTEVLGDLGFESYEAFVEASEAPTATADGDDRAALAAEVAEAEAAWAAFEATEPGALPPGAASDALRARAYRLLGVVLDDHELEADLQSLISLQARHDAARTLLEGALRDAGFDPGDDPAALARMWLKAR